LAHAPGHDSSKKIALVTGANKGIGFEVARRIGRSGATVLVSARNRLAGEKAAAALAGEGLAAAPAMRQEPRLGSQGR
jgi:NAD(P)-dependent dehydrogenase (short-subunit alcohol dehydrogenase family)